MALEIRDDRTARPKERIRAGEFLRGPKAAPGVTVNVSQVNATAPAGYVIDLSGRPRDSEPPPKTIDMSPKKAMPPMSPPTLCKNAPKPNVRGRAGTLCSRKQ